MTRADRSDADATTVAAFQRGDHAAFTRLSERHFRELHVHCYRMVGSFDEAEDLVQETFLRAWRGRDSYGGRATMRAWLYRIATNVCIDTLRTRAPRAEAVEAEGVPAYSNFPWMQPYPDGLLDTIGGDGERPDARVVSRETIELAFLATIQLLPPKQRAVLILRDILEFSAAETAEALDDTTASVNSALQRARATLTHRRTPATPLVPSGCTTFDEAVLLQAYMDAQERGDVNAMVQFLREDVRMTLFPEAVTWDGRESVCCEFFKTVGAFGGGVRSIPIAANRQPAMGVYLQRPGDTAYRAWAVVVLGVLDGKLREISSFASPELFARFQLPQSLEAPPPSAP